MATTNNSIQSTPQKRRLSHITAHYDYSSPIFKKAENPLYDENMFEDDPFKYYPILCNLHLMCETYHDTCWALKHKDLSPEEWSLHLSKPHNYACIHKQCSLQFVERKHLEKHVPICKASQLLMASRKERSKEIYKNLINFPKIKPVASKKKKKKALGEQYDHTEKVWITCYPDSSYVCPKLSGVKRSLYVDPTCIDPSYLDPKHNPPIAVDDCYFAHVTIEEKVAQEPKKKHKLKKRRITPQKPHRKTRNKSKKRRTLHSSSDELEDSDTESSTSSSDSDSSTRSEDHPHDMKTDESTDSEHDHHNNNNHNNNKHNNNKHNNNKHVHQSSDRKDHASHNRNTNNNNTDNARTIRKIPASSKTNDTQNKNEAHDMLMNDMNDASCTQITQSSVDSYPTSTNSLETLLHLPNLNAFPAQNTEPHSFSLGTKRKAEELDDSIDCIPPYKKQKLSALYHMNMNKHRIPSIQQAIALPISTGTVTNLTVTPILEADSKLDIEENIQMNDIPLPPSSRTNSLILSHATSMSPCVESMPRPQSILSTSKQSKFMVPLSFCRITSSEDDEQTKQKKRKRKKKKAKHAVKTVIDLTDDDVVEMDAENDTHKDSEWPHASYAMKLRYIFHPFHIYSVSQQFTDKSYTKAKKQKRKKRDIKCYKMNESTASFTEQQLNKKWKSIQESKAHPLKNLRDKFNGSEISFEFLNFVQIVPSEHDINATHIMTSADLVTFAEGLFTNDTTLQYLNVYPSSFRSKMRALLIPHAANELSLKSKVFLYSFLRCGVGLLPKAFNTESVSSAKHIHNAYYQFLNDHFRAQSVYKNAGVRDIVFKKDGSCFKEFVFRHHPTSEDWSNCTLDLSLKMGGIICNELENLLEQCIAIQSLKTLYNALYPNKHLRLVNMGFFQSPPENPGQNWHTDYEFSSIHDKYTQMSPVVTVIISVTKQKYDAMTTTGSTVFCLGSNQSATQIRKLCKKYPNECENWLYKAIQPVLNEGDIACFAGHTMHFGGAYNYLQDKDQLEDRIALYGVLHLLPKTAKHDAYLETDMNIDDGKKVESLFGGGRYNIIRKPNDESDNKEDVNPYVVKKYRWRDRNQYKL